MRTSARNAAYPRVSEIDAFRRASAKAPASRHIREARCLEPGLIAMRKVEGSNPFSRFFANCLAMVPDSVVCRFQAAVR